MESSGEDQFLVLAIGGVGINTTPVNSDVELTIMAAPGNSDYANVFMRQASTPAGILFSAGQATSGNNNAQFFIDQFDGTNQTRRLSIGTTGDLTVSANAFKPGGGSWSATSDRRIKQDVTPILDALDTVMKLRPVNFRYTEEYRATEGGLADKSYAGFIAQEYREVFPDAVVSTDKHVPGAAKTDPTILALDPNPALITTVAAVQELALENATLHKQVENLEARLEKLESGMGQ
jgi:Chaperone of endosialidase